MLEEVPPQEAEHVLEKTVIATDEGELLILKHFLNTSKKESW